MRVTIARVYRPLLLVVFCVWLWTFYMSAQPAANRAIALSFAKSEYAVTENSSEVAVLVKRVGDTNDTITVDLVATNATAQHDKDFILDETTLTIWPGVRESRVVIQIVDNSLGEPNKTFQLRLTNPTGGATIGKIGVTTVTIIDNDGQKSVLLTFGLDHVGWFRNTVAGIPLWQFLASLIYIFLAFYFSRLLDFLLRARLEKWVRKTSPRIDDLLVTLLRGPLKIIVFVILLHIGLEVFLWPDWIANFLSKALKVVVAISITYVILKVIDLLLGVWRQRASAPDDEQFHRQLFPIIRNSLNVFVVAVACLVTSQNLGFNITGLITSLGIGGLALALAAQDTLSNLFGAIAILIDKPFRVGDRITLENVDGIVEGIGFRSTRVRNQDGHLVTVPNKTMGNATITNIAQRRNIRTKINIGLPYETPPEKIREAIAILNEVYRANPQTVDVWINFDKFADSWLNIYIIHWWGSTDQKGYLAGMHELNMAIKTRFDEAKIGFAFPSQTLYLKQDSEWSVGHGPNGPPQLTTSGAMPPTGRPTDPPSSPSPSKLRPEDLHDSTAPGADD